MNSLNHTIEDFLLKIEKRVSVSDNPFLYVGKGGEVLYYAYKFLHSKDETYYSISISLLEECFDEIRFHSVEHCNLNSLAGLGWLLQHLVNLSIVDLDDDNASLLETIDLLVSNSIQADLKNNNYDFIFGLTGKGVYFIERLIAGTNVREELRSVIEGLKANSHQSNEGICWVDSRSANSLQESEHACVNLGLAHGLPSIISFLCMADDYGLLQKDDITLLNGAVSFLLSAEKPKGMSCFPNINSLDESSRLAWCYGDLGVAISLMQASKVLNSDYIKNEAIRIALHTTKRTISTADIHSFEELDLIDTGICHGLAGIVHLYHVLYKATSHACLKDTFQYWLRNLLNQLERQELAIAAHGIEKVTNLCVQDSNAIWVVENNLIAGKMGIGLVLMNVLNEGMAGWDRIFLTSK